MIDGYVSTSGLRWTPSLGQHWGQIKRGSQDTLDELEIVAGGPIGQPPAKYRYIAAAVLHKPAFS